MDLIEPAIRQFQKRLASVNAAKGFDYRVTTCLENLEMSGNLTAVSEMSGILLKIREMSGKKSCQGKVASNYLLYTAYVHPFGYLVGVYSV